MATIGIPFAFFCDQCWQAAICPACGKHIETTERKDFESFTKREYADHWAAEHEGRVEIGNLSRRDGTRYLGVVDVSANDGVGRLLHDAFRAAPDGCPVANR